MSGRTYCHVRSMMYRVSAEVLVTVWINQNIVRSIRLAALSLVSICLALSEDIASPSKTDTNVNGSVELIFWKYEPPPWKSTPKESQGLSSPQSVVVLSCASVVHTKEASRAALINGEENMVIKREMVGQSERLLMAEPAVYSRHTNTLFSKLPTCNEEFCGKVNMHMDRCASLALSSPGTGQDGVGSARGDHDEQQLLRIDTSDHIA
jgi:hypothetical protein